MIDRLDHRNLNLEVEEFRNLNPTVEMYCTSHLAVARWPADPLKLQQIRVYETPKTWADVVADDESVLSSQPAHRGTVNVGLSAPR